MDFKDYLSLLKQVKFGKRLQDALYLHRCGLKHLPKALHSYLQDEIAKLQLSDFPYDLIKLHLKAFKISL